MYTKHLPEGSFKRILSRRRSSFPPLTRHEIAELELGTNPEIADLREMREFSQLCTFVDTVCDYLGIPPINLHWAPESDYVKGYLTEDSNSIVLTSDINLVVPQIIEGVAVHEIGHGLQGDIELQSRQPGDLGKYYRHMREFRSDTFAALLHSRQVVHDMLFLFEHLRSFALGARNDSDMFRIATEETETHPPLMVRRVSLIGIELSDSWQQLVSKSRNKDQIIHSLFAEEPKIKGVEVLRDSLDRERAMAIVNEGPYFDYFAVMKNGGYVR